MSANPKKVFPIVDQKAMLVSGWFPRIARIRAEQHDPLDDPAEFIGKLRAGIDADVFTFLQPISDLTPRHPYNLEWEDSAVLKYASYDSWWKTQLNDKTRNMIRKAAKKGIEIRISTCDDEFIKGIKEIYDESPIRQGRPFRHYGKDLQILRDAHLSFLERSEFIGAYFEGNLVGFIKLIYHPDSASIMQIISKMAHRDKAPTNALLAKAVELCSMRGICIMQYGIWSRRSLGEFKKHHGFERVRIPRYYVPLNLRGKVALLLHLNRNPLAILPESWMDWMATLRARWYSGKVTDSR